MNRFLKMLPLILICLPIAYCGINIATMGTYRAPNAYEFEYPALAMNLKSSIPCEKISPQARELLLLNPNGARVSPTRSQCYFYLAMVTGDKSYCKEVKTVYGFFFNNTRYNKSACLKQGGMDTNQRSPFYALHALKMDYKEVAHLKAQYFCNDPNDFPRLYRCFLEFKPQSLIRYLKNLPDYSKEQSKGQPDKLNDDLLRAIEFKKYDLAKSLIAQGADVNYSATGKVAFTTPLLITLEHSPSASSDFEKYLIDHGADINLADPSNTTPLAIAYEYKKIDVLKLFLQKNVNFDIRPGAPYQVPTKEDVLYLIRTGNHPPYVERK